MFIHNFKYSFKILCRNKALVFWTFAFPIILVTLFSLTFSNIESSEQLNVFSIGIVDNEEYKEDTILKETLEKLGDHSSSDQLFDIVYGSEEELQTKLEKDDVVGYLVVKEKSHLVVKENGIEQTVFSQVIDEITQTKKIVNEIATEEIKNQWMNGQSVDSNQIYQNILKNLSSYTSSVKDNSKNNLSYTMIEYYTVIAMTCLYGAMLGMYAVNNNLANMSKNGMRVSISPTKKVVTTLSSALASYVLQLIGMTLLFLYTYFVIRVDYGSNLFYIVLLALFGCLAGCTFGIAISTLLKTNENNKIGIITSITMIGSFLSGMMGITMKYVIDTNLPLLNQLNPVNMITDGFYALYYSGLGRYWNNITSLLLFSAVMIVIAIFVLRRQKYDSI